MGGLFTGSVNFSGTPTAPSTHVLTYTASGINGTEQATLTINLIPPIIAPDNGGGPAPPGGSPVVTPPVVTPPVVTPPVVTPPVVTPPVVTPPVVTPPTPSGDVEILVVYTDAAEQANGGAAGIVSLAGLAVGNVDNALSNSGINASASLAGTMKWAHPSTGVVSSDLGALISDATIKAARTTFNADLVAALVSGAPSGMTGYGAIPLGLGGNSAACWSVTRAAAVGAPVRSFAHEIGHNFGAGHDAAQGGPNAVPTARGLRFTGNDGKQYCTLLAYQQGSGQRIPYYSNPSVVYAGKPTGTASANNAATIQTITAAAAAYK
jgi:hypothetical protein